MKCLIVPSCKASGSSSKDSQCLMFWEFSLDICDHLNSYCVLVPTGRKVTKVVQFLVMGGGSKVNNVSVPLLLFISGMKAKS